MLVEGGGIFIDDGVLVLKGRSQLVDNVASGEGNSLKSLGGALTYVLPTPAGHWIAGMECSVYRQGCERDRKGNPKEEACAEAAAHCSTLTDGNATSNGYPCLPFLLNQPCDWERTPELVGQMVHVAPRGATDSDLPSKCAPGLLGSDDVKYQASAVCAGLCPAGKLCSEAATVIPADCPAGHACPQGSSVALPCRAGSYSAAANLESSDGCLRCPGGSFCPPGADKPTHCSPGSYAETSSTECIACPNLQFFTTLSSGSASANDCVCKAGRFMNYVNLTEESAELSYNDRNCDECPSAGGYDCSAPGNALQTLSIKAGYWRAWSLSTVVRQCFTEKFCIGTATAQDPISDNATASRRHLSSWPLADNCTWGSCWCWIRLRVRRRPRHCHQATATSCV